jgi:hypothetical protein
MPVFMEEAVMLRCQLQALEWANKAALVLPHASSLTVTENYWDDDPDQSVISSANNEDDDVEKERGRGRPRLVEVQRLAKEIKRYAAITRRIMLTYRITEFKLMNKYI